MDPLDAVETLARRARLEAPPLTDVNVRQIPRVALSEPLRLFPLAWTAAASVLIATTVVCFAFRANAARSEGIAPLFAASQVEMP